MNVTANHRRAAVLSFLALLSCVTPGCVPRTSQTSSNVPSSTEASSTDTSASAPISEVTLQQSETLQQPLASREVLSETGDGMGVEVGNNDAMTTVSIATSNGAAGYTVERLENPPRLVIDLPGTKTTGGKSIALDDSKLARSMRIGAHPTKSRIVLDLRSDAVSSQELVGTDGKLVVTLRDTTAASAPSTEIARISESSISEDLNNPVEQLASSEIDTSPSFDPANDVPVVAALPSEKEDLMAQPKADAIESAGDIGSEVSVLPARVEDSVKTEELETTAKANKPSVSEKQENSVVITGVRLEAGAANSPMVVADVKGEAEYRLEKTAPSEYVLTFKNATLENKEDATTLLADPKSVGIRSVRTTSSEDLTVVRIFSQPNAYLTARTSAGRVIVENTTDLAKAAKQLVGDDTDRAQLDPKEAEKAAAKEQKTEVVKATDTGKSGSKAEVSASDSELTDSDLGALLDDSSKYTGRLISLDLQDTDIDNALRIIAEVSNLNIVASDDVAGKVTLRLTDVPWDQALDVILKTNGLDKVIEGNVMRVAPVDKLRQERESLKQAQQAEEELEPLSVKYLRVSYAKAAELKSLVETVLSERGTVAYDERSNQLIVKDVKKGLKNVIELVNKVDLRTPQVLLETQIVEATRNLGRELGAELGFQLIQSPLTGNGTGLNFPAAISIGGSAITGGGITGSSFPVASGAAGGSAVTALFDSADGTKSLQLRLSALESEGRVRIISRPAVATTNNKAATIKSVEKVRVRLPNGGLSVATGAGAAANGAPGLATEVIEAGIVLDVVPQASPDYFVLLDIKAKSSSFSAREADGIPNEIERSASSTVLVSSGQTFALGGIYKISDSDRISGVPFFKDIPVLGHLFRRSVIDNNDEELLFFITPRIVEGSFDDAAMRSGS